MEAPAGREFTTTDAEPDSVENTEVLSTFSGSRVKRILLAAAGAALLTGCGAIPGSQKKSEDAQEQIPEIYEDEDFSDEFPDDSESMDGDSMENGAPESAVGAWLPPQAERVYSERNSSIVIGGTIIEKLHMEKHIESFVLSAGSVDIESPDLTIRERLIYAKEQMLDTFKKVFPYILVGVGIGALIHNWIPESWVETILGSNNPFGVILATIVGIPMYADIFGTIPVAEALLSKGAQLGTVLSFMMAVTTLSLPSLIMLRKAVKPKLLALFIGVCTIGIIIVGYLFNVFQFILM